MRIVSHPKKPAVQKPAVTVKPFIQLTPVRVVELRESHGQEEKALRC